MNATQTAETSGKSDPIAALQAIEERQISRLGDAISHYVETVNAVADGKVMSDGEANEFLATLNELGLTFTEFRQDARMITDLRHHQRVADGRAEYERRKADNIRRHEEFDERRKPIVEKLEAESIALWNEREELKREDDLIRASEYEIRHSEREFAAKIDRLRAARESAVKKRY